MHRLVSKAKQTLCLKCIQMNQDYLDCHPWSALSQEALLLNK